MRKVTLNQAQI